MLAKAEIWELIDTQGLVTGYVDRETQIQPNGFDLTISDLRMVISDKPGRIDFGNGTRYIPQQRAIQPSNGAWELYPGIAYIGVIGEKVNLPPNIAALTFARSSLMRCGVHVSTAVWDKGYRGRGQVGIATNTTVILTQGARILQMVFFRVDNDGSGYHGTYQGENE